MSIHPTSIIDPSAKIAKDVQIGPFCTIGEDVQIESGSKIISHAVIKGPTELEKIIVFINSQLLEMTLLIKSSKEKKQN